MQSSPTAPRRFLVVGVPGSGKTTFAKQIAERLGIPHIELDELFWGPSWTPPETEEFRERVRVATNGGGWSACGSYYSKLKDLTWGAADVIVWLDLPGRTTLWRLVRRTLVRIFRRERLWNDNRETIRNTFFSRDSLLVWWWRIQRLNPEQTLSRAAASSQAQLVRLHSSSDAEKWLLKLVETSQDRSTPESVPKK